MRRKVEEIVRETLRPLVEADGGSLTIVEVTDARIELRLGAACAGCPGLAYTRRELLEPLLRQVVGAAPSIEIHSRPVPQRPVPQRPVPEAAPREPAPPEPSQPPEAE